MAIKRILQIGDPKLRAENKNIRDFNSPLLKRLITDLKDTMYKKELIGIAAPQIRGNLSVFITHVRTTHARSKISDALRIYVNPKITYLSQALSVIYEGCGSVADGTLFGPVERPKIILVEAENEKGERFRLKCDGILARVIQHEYDHLQGKEYTGKIKDLTKLMDISFYRKSIRNSPAQLPASKITLIEYNMI